MFDNFIDKLLITNSVILIKIATQAYNMLHTQKQWKGQEIRIFSSTTVADM